MYIDATDFKYNIYFRLGTSILNSQYAGTITQSGGTSIFSRNMEAALTNALRANNIFKNALTSVLNPIRDQMASMSYDLFKSAARQAAGVVSTNTANYFTSFNGKTIKTQDGKFYEITVKNVDSENINLEVVNAGNTQNLFRYLANAVADSHVFDPNYSVPDNNSFKLSGKKRGLKCIIVEKEGIQATAKVSTSRNKTIDSIYDIIATPLDEVNIGVINNDGTFSSKVITNKYTNINIMTTIAKELASACYDLQVLPYCPIQNAITSQVGQIAIDETLEGKAFDYVKDEEENILGCIFYVPESNFTFNIDCNMPVERPMQTEDFRSIGTVNAFGIRAAGQLFVYNFDRFVYADKTLHAGNLGVYQNSFTVYKYNKVSFQLIETYNVAEIYFHDMKFHMRVAYDRNHYTTKEVISRSDLETGNFYLAFDLSTITLYNDSPVM